MECKETFKDWARKGAMMEGLKRWDNKTQLWKLNQAHHWCQEFKLLELIMNFQIKLTYSIQNQSNKKQIYLIKIEKMSETTPIHHDLKDLISI